MHVASSDIKKRLQRRSLQRKNNAFFVSRFLTATCLGLLVSGGLSFSSVSNAVVTPPKWASLKDSSTGRASGAITISRFELVAEDADVLQVKLYTQGGRVQYRTQIEDQGMVIRLPNAKLSATQIESGYPVILDASHRYIGRALPDSQTGGVKVVLPNVPTDSVLVSVSQFVSNPAPSSTLVDSKTRAATTGHAIRASTPRQPKAPASGNVHSGNLKPAVLPATMQAAPPTENRFERVPTPIVMVSSGPETESFSEASLSTDRPNANDQTQAVSDVPSGTVSQPTPEWIHQLGLDEFVSTLDFYNEVSLLKKLLQWSALLVVFLGVGLLGGLMVFTVLGWMIQNLMPERLTETARQQQWSPENWSRDDMLVPGSLASTTPPNTNPFPALEPDPSRTRAKTLSISEMRGSASLHHGGSHGRQAVLAHQAQVHETLTDVQESKAVLKSLAKKLRDVRCNSESVV